MAATNQPAAMDVDEAAIDEGLYSRQLYASSWSSVGKQLTSSSAMYLDTKVWNIAYTEVWRLTRAIS